MHLEQQKRLIGKDASDLAGVVGAEDLCVIGVLGAAIDVEVLIADADAGEVGIGEDLCDGLVAAEKPSP